MRQIQWIFSRTEGRTRPVGLTDYTCRSPGHPSYSGYQWTNQKCPPNISAYNYTYKTTYCIAGLHGVGELKGIWMSPQRNKRSRAGSIALAKTYVNSPLQALLMPLCPTS